MWIVSLGFLLYKSVIRLVLGPLSTMLRRKDNHQKRIFDKSSYLEIGLFQSL